ncbi:type II secretion system protein [Chlamydia gallinacea]|uniref:Prepilin-type N-terminal cleavage/methylation domain-containing protein n=2 Tax=Chlamydia gallinacea TaxID=1457153 RepID=A0A173DYJ9_9CHLA|nr:type II secretion system protein [Chlamydia gallinacea]EYE60682.1 prepilin-type N-terminal cleavage/methylation domain protein [Bacteroides fragilis str. S6L5]ANG66009.1 prepilin-type N-terminal cleavage/methylation domain-containing protein [Chlamydia gallinacea 08-1274/3]AQT77946.1 prepilin-type N-terminal cleavage/methylation domain-containing protein [Chlamydia gallinacea]MBX6680080.1 type II secretion system protein [Chlamydia gallinacea]MBX6687312.1 type II secretion system protein [C
MNKYKRKQSITLIEMMVVITLIGIIGGALAFNMRGSIQKGKAFQSEQNCAKIYDILMMEYATGNLSLREIVDRKEVILEGAAWCKEGKKLLKDAWGEDIIVKVSETGDDLVVFSSKAHGVNNKQQG